MYRPILNSRVLANSPLNDAHGVGQRIDRDTVGGTSVNHRLCIGQLSVKFQMIISRYMGRYIRQYLTDIVQLPVVCQPILDNICIDRY